MKKTITILYFIVLALNIYSETAGYTILHQVFKSLLMPLLVLYYWLNHTKPVNYLLILALIFSWFGDLFLMFRDRDFFMQGLVSFLVAHVFYIVLFKSQAKINLVKAIPFVLFSALYFSVIQHSIPSKLLIPVVIYCSILTLMGIFAACRNPHLSNYKTILIGAILFILSDSFLAFNKFVAPLKMSTFLIMATYGTAQYLIMRGYTKSNQTMD